jgi:hypothetical protein
MEGYAKLGVEMVDIMPTGSDPVRYVSGLDELVPKLAELGGG